MPDGRGSDRTINKSLQIVHRIIAMNSRIIHFVRCSKLSNDKSKSLSFRVDSME